MEEELIEENLKDDSDEELEHEEPEDEGLEDEDSEDEEPEEGTEPYSEQMKSTISKLRRRANDTVQPYTFSDELLYGFIADAVDALELESLRMGRAVKDGDFIDARTGRPVEVSSSEQAVYVLKAFILLTTAIKSGSDRDNFNLRKPNLAVDTSKQSSDHAETIRLLNQELDKLLFNLIFNGSGGGMGARMGMSGVRVE